MGGLACIWKLPLADLSSQPVADVSIGPVSAAAASVLPTSSTFGAGKGWFTSLNGANDVVVVGAVVVGEVPVGSVVVGSVGRVELFLSVAMLVPVPVIEAETSTLSRGNTMIPEPATVV